MKLLECCSSCLKASISFFVACLFSNLHAQSQLADLHLVIGSPDSSEYVSALMTDEKGDIYMPTMVFHRTDRQSRLKIFKISREGKVMWSKFYPDRKTSIFTILKRPNGRLVMAGSIENEVKHDNFYIMETDSSGNLIWEKSLKKGVRGFIMQMFQTNDGLVSTAFEFIDPDSTGIRKIIYLIKTDFEGNQIWEKKFPIKSGNDVITLILKNGNILYVPTQSEGQSTQPLTLFILKPDGTIEKEIPLGSVEIRSAIELADGQILFLVNKPNKEDPSGASCGMDLKRLQGDALVSVAQFSECPTYCPMETVGGNLFIYYTVDKKLGVLGLNDHFMPIGKGLIPSEGNVGIDGFLITGQQELLYTRVLRSALPDVDPITKKSKLNYDLLLERVKVSRLFEH